MRRYKKYLACMLIISQILMLTPMKLHAGVLEAGAGCVMLTAMQLMEISSFFVLIPIRMYNGRRGWNIKWFFYAFYPLHILLLYLIACAMGLGGIRLMR